MTGIDVETNLDGVGPAPAHSHRPRGRWVLVACVVAVVAAATVTAWAVSGRSGSPAYDAAQIGWMHDGCVRWADSYRGSGPDAAWCNSMADWMNGRAGLAKRGGPMGSMMWHDPDSMRASCREWSGSGGGATASGAQGDVWCDQMVEWMTTHMGDWDQWMRRGPMMDGS